MAVLTVVIPVRDEDPEILQRLLDHLRPYRWPVLVIDDGSQQPVQGAAIRFPPPGRGYGAALKAGIDRAQTELVCTMDGDGQHSVWDVKRLEDFFLYFCNVYDDQQFYVMDMVIGDRRLRERGRRWVGRKALNVLASLFAWRWINDLNSGLRIFRRKIAVGYVPILSDGFSFTASLTLSFLTDGYTVDWLPIQVTPRRKGTTKVRLWRDGWVTLRTILWIGMGLRTRWIRAWFRRLMAG